MVYQSQVKVVREKKKMLQRELAERAGISHEHLSEIERGDCNPTLKSAKKIASVLECHVTDLFETVTGYIIKNQRP
jgi:DNA-binding XRE family transcriptional regulator